MHDSRLGRMVYLLHDLWRQTRRWQEIVSRERGLTVPQFRMIGQLCKADGISQSELSNLTDSDPMTVSGIVERLEAKHLVRREPHPTDSRAKVVFVTDAARKLVDEMRAKALSREPLVFEGISDADYQTTMTVLRTISQNLAGTHPDDASAHHVSKAVHQ